MTHDRKHPIGRDSTIRSDRGAGFVEYALLMALLVMVLIGALEAFGTDTKGSIDDSASSVASYG